MLTKPHKRKNIQVSISSFQVWFFVINISSHVMVFSHPRSTHWPLVVLMGVPLLQTDVWSILVRVIIWCQQPTSHYHNQCWPSSMMPYGITRSQWVNGTTAQYDIIMHTILVCKHEDVIHALILISSLKQAMICYDISGDNKLCRGILLYFDMQWLGTSQASSSAGAFLV